jgi:hypothetical protein
LSVIFEVDGTASNGLDYETLGGLAIFPGGSRTTQILVRVRDDQLIERQETVRVRLEADPHYRLGPLNEAVAFIVDNDRHSSKRRSVVRSLDR